MEYTQGGKDRMSTRRLKEGGRQESSTPSYKYGVKLFQSLERWRPEVCQSNYAMYIRILSNIRRAHGRSAQAMITVAAGFEAYDSPLAAVEYADIQHLPARPGYFTEFKRLLNNK